MMTIQASGDALALLAADAGQSENCILEHPVWLSVFNGTLSKPQLKRLLLAIYPALAGPGRYAFAAKVSQIDAQDGKTLFLKLHEALKRPEANADTGWAAVLRAIGATDREIAAALARPSAEAEDFVAVVRMHGLRSSAVEASVVAYLLERQLPALCGHLAAALEKHYSVARGATAYLRFEAARSAETEKWVKHLVDAYVAPAEPYKVFEGRRAGREAVWAWTVLTESS